MPLRLATNPTLIPTWGKSWESITNRAAESESRSSRVVPVAMGGERRHLGTESWFLSDLSDYPTRLGRICGFSESGRVGRVGRFECQPRLDWARGHRISSVCFFKNARHPYVLRGATLSCNAPTRLRGDAAVALGSPSGPSRSVVASGHARETAGVVVRGSSPTSPRGTRRPAGSTRFANCLRSERSQKPHESGRSRATANYSRPA